MKNYQMPSKSSFIKALLVVAVLVILAYTVFASVHRVGINPQSSSSVMVPADQEKQFAPASYDTKTTATIETDKTTGKDFITLGGNKCEVVYRTENPHKKGEYLLATAGYCLEQNNLLSVFLKNGGLLQKIPLNSATYPYPYDNPYWTGTPVGQAAVFLDADEIIYGTANGEGAGCASGGTEAYNRINIRTGAVSTAASGGMNSHCHDPLPEDVENYNPSQCWDETRDYSFGSADILFSMTCPTRLKTGQRIFTVLLNKKQIFASKIADSDMLVFSGIENTANMLKGGNSAVFILAGKAYRLDIATGALSQ